MLHWSLKQSDPGFPTLNGLALNGFHLNWVLPATWVVFSTPCIGFLEPRWPQVPPARWGLQLPAAALGLRFRRPQLRSEASFFFWCHGQNLHRHGLWSINTWSILFVVFVFHRCRGRPWSKTKNRNGHGLWSVHTWSMVMIYGLRSMVNYLWSWFMVMVYGHGLWSWSGHGLWAMVD